jgi:hypothetical protein
LPLTRTTFSTSAASSGVPCGDVDRALPDLLGDVEVLGGADDQADAPHVQEEQRQDLQERRLAVLAGDQQHDRAEPERPVGQQLEGVDRQPLLPGQQRRCRRRPWRTR